MENNSNAKLLLYMLDDIRDVTIHGIKDLSKEKLFNPPVEGEFPIGAYLMHLAECDLGWLSRMTGEEPSEELKKRVYHDSWYDCWDPTTYNPPKEPLETEEYINAITEARELLRKYVMTLNDSELEADVPKAARGNRRMSRKQIIYHLAEHEAHTRGQMFLLIRMGGLKSKGENNYPYNA